jgi:hypothetical protein
MSAVRPYPTDEFAPPRLTAIWSLSGAKQTVRRYEGFCAGTCTHMEVFARVASTLWATLQKHYLQRDR